MIKIHTVLSPMLLPLTPLEDKTVVVIDVLRATSSMCVAFAHEAQRILPVATPDECLKYREQGFIVAAERDGQPVAGFDMGNSPFSYMSEHIKGASLAITTTNGTQAIQASNKAAQVIIGSFLNKNAVVDFILKYQHDVILLCSGWKNNFNLEDTLLAGALAQALDGRATMADDATIAAMDLYQTASTNLNRYIRKSSHAHRFSALGIEADIDFCMQENIYDIVPVLRDGYLIREV